MRKKKSPRGQKGDDEWEMKKMVDAVIVAAMLMAYVPSLQEEAVKCLNAPVSVQMLLPDASDTTEDEQHHGLPC